MVLQLKVEIFSLMSTVLLNIFDEFSTAENGEIDLLKIRILPIKVSSHKTYSRTYLRVV